MTFTDRTMLAALVALAIPVAIHLVGRRRARRMVLPTVRFAEAAHQAGRAAARLRHAALLAFRLAAVALLVLALAGPRWEGHRLTVAGTATNNTPSPVAVPATAKQSPAPIRVLIVDAEEAGEGVHSADLVAATFTGDTNIPKQVTLIKADDISMQDLAATNVFVWVGPRPNLYMPLLQDHLASGDALVLIPGSAPKSRREVKGLPAIVDAPDGITIDPDGYTSDLLAAFEGGTSGDLAAPVFRRRLKLEGQENSVIRFHDGSTAIAEYRIGRGRVVALAFGPDPSWGDLASRPEFVVLMHSLAEALAPNAAPKPYLAPGEYTGGNATKADSHEPPPVYSRGANNSPGANKERGANEAGIDLTPWLILALAVVLVAEGLLAAASAPRGNAPPPGK